MLLKTKCIVLSAIKYGEADLIVRCYTQTDGIKSFLLRNVLKSKRSPIKASYFQPLTQLDIVATDRKKGTLEYLREVKRSIPYETLHTDLVKSSVVMFLAEILKNVIQEEEANEALFNFLAEAFVWLDRHDHVANFHIYFLLQLSAYLGFYPDTTHIEAPFFNIYQGRFEAYQDQTYTIEGEVVEVFKSFFSTDLNGIQHIKMGKSNRAELLNMLLTYYQLHVQGYQKPKSLAILNQLF